jgi:hypothetical protein
VFARRPVLVSYSTTSLFLVNTVNHFGHVGGVHCLVARLLAGQLPFLLLQGLCNVRGRRRPRTMCHGPCAVRVHVGRCLRTCSCELRHPAVTHCIPPVPPLSPCSCAQIVYVLRGVLLPRVGASLVEALRCKVFPTVLALPAEALKPLSKEQFGDIMAVMEALLTAFRSGPVLLPRPDAPLPAGRDAMAALAASAVPPGDLDSGGSRYACLRRSSPSPSPPSRFPLARPCPFPPPSLPMCPPCLHPGPRASHCSSAYRGHR